MNTLTESVRNEVERYLSIGTSIRSVERILGVHRDTVMRIKHGKTFRSKRAVGECRAISQPERMAIYGKAVPGDMRLGWTCHVPYCANPDHFVLKENLNFGRRDYSDIRKRLWECADGEYFDLIGESCYEKDVLKLRTGLAVNSPHFIVRTLPDRSGLRIIRGGDWYEPKKDILAKIPILVPATSGFSRLNLLWEPETNGDCLLAPTPMTAYKMRFRSIGIDRTARDRTKILDAKCGNPRCYAKEHVFSRARRIGTGKRSNDIGTGFFLGFMWGTSKVEIPIQEVPRCGVRSCAFPEHQQSGLCHTHLHWFYVEGLGDAIDVRDMYADDNASTYPTLSVGMLYEDRYNWLNVRKEGYPGKSEAERTNDAWWHENVIKAGLEVDGVITPKIRGSVLPDVLGRLKNITAETLKPGVGAQTSGSLKMRHHDKKKIRKTQRKRPAGWKGSRGAHDPVGRWDREVIEMDYDDFPDFPQLPSTISGLEDVLD
jgi:hypothetical protein